jgi:hypothetical protein
MDEGLMHTINVPMYLEDGTVANLRPYLVGDSAFPLGQHLMKVIEPPPPSGPAERKLNNRLLNARRRMEQAFGRLKGRFALHKKNTFWNLLDFVQMGIEACCGLYSFQEQRLGELPEVDQAQAQMNELELPQEQDGVARQGAHVRDTLVQWVREH